MDAPATYEEPWSDTTRLATEFLVEARAGGTCVVRLVTTFNDPGHGDELASMDGGWTGFLDNLRLYLTHFRGLPAVPVALMATVAETPGDALERALASIGAADAQAGDRVLDGVVERRGDDELLVRREASLLGFGAFAWDGETKVAVRETCYGPDAAAASAAATERWEAWIGATFGAAAVR